MSIPYNPNISWEVYNSKIDWDEENKHLIWAKNPETHHVAEIFVQAIKQTVIRGAQFTRDAARLVLKVPVRSILTPIVLPSNWKERERAKINVMLTGYSFVQLLLVPVKFCVALAAIAAVAMSFEKARGWINQSELWTAHLDGRASQLEALKEEGRVNAKTPREYKKYSDWLYGIVDPKQCRKPV